jgi:type VI secretion system protein
VAYRGSLFERLSTGHGVTAVSDEEALYQSVANNLSRIFSTNAGSAETVADYGRPDLNNLHVSQKESIDIIEKGLEENIRKYEPRLYNARAGISRERLHVNEMYIHIEGFLYINGAGKKVHFKANLSGSGVIKVIKDDD